MRRLPDLKATPMTSGPEAFLGHEGESPLRT
jgi:hypothetical protein